MKRLFALSLALLAAACGAPQNAANDHANGGTAMEGPDADGNFYVVGFAGAALPYETVTLRNVEGRTIEVAAEADGSFAAMLWNSMDKTVDVETSSAVAQAASAAPQKINVNFASKTGLEAVPGIGDSLALRIISHRQIHGLFSEVDDLELVDGIGPTSLDNMRDFVETKIDVNVASKNQLMVLPGIGAAKAAAIIAYRNAHGAFLAPSDLLLVEGISADVFTGIKPFIKAGVVPSHPGAALVNVNKDGADKLMTLPGIGEGKAKAITDYRKNHGAFFSKDDLLFVPGIGPTTLANIRDLVTVGVLDPKVGTFVAEGAWAYSAAGDDTGSSFPAPVLVRFEHSLSADELLVTFVGGGYCEGTADCSPFTLKGTVIGETENDGFRYVLSGYMPADGGNYTVYGDVTDEGEVTELGATIAFTAVRGDESYRLALSGFRVLE